MLQKLGWKEGDSLGKEGKGLLEPVIKKFPLILFCSDFKLVIDKNRA